MTYLVDQIQVVVQPQSIIHSMVEYVDGAVIAQLGTPDMKLPIQYALYYPGDAGIFREIAWISAKLAQIGLLRSRIWRRFTDCRLRMKPGRAGGSLPTVFNAANERAVSTVSRNGRSQYLEIPEIIAACMRASQEYCRSDSGSRYLRLSGKPMTL